jgi:ribonuclease HI
MTQAQTPSKHEYTIHADGACKGNPGPGGWGALIDKAGTPRIHLNGYDASTTNNRMELTGLIAGLGNIPEGASAEVVTDSEYAKKGMTEWIQGWKRRGWVTAQKQPVKNKDLWVALDALCSARKLTWTWVKGHAGHPGNEMADALANEAVAAKKSTRP